ncbi:hypothetical protein BDL97_06G081200 [Sphagnum fallax]|nr:hypothetical protein BDL97_06G081200 [Sphagnum fallax]KAH8959512.1 hypothetical protein BDL97_06G081200 [Sphagnum fallax]
MQFRPDGGDAGFDARRAAAAAASSFSGAPPLRGGFPVDYGPRADDRRLGLASPVSKTVSYSGNSKGEEDDALPSRHLWVGNVSQEVSEAILKEKFSQFGEVDNVTVYSSRNYAFVNFVNQEEAVEAKNLLHGVMLGGLAMRIEFAKGARQSRHLWVGGIGQNVTKEQIEVEFKRFGPLEDFKLLRERSCAFVDYVRMEDAVAAVEALNRKRIGEDTLRVDFGKSSTQKREGNGDERSGAPKDHRGGAAPDGQRGRQDAMQVVGGMGPSSGEGRGKADKDGGPSEVLWVGFPLLSNVDEEGLKRAFLPFGEIERIKTFPGRTYAFVQFKSVEDATRAKDNLEGKLFNDPRVHIRFSKSEIGPVDNPRDTPRNMDNLLLPSSRWVGDGQGPRGPLAGSEQFSSPGRPSNTSSLRAGGLRPEYRPESFMAGPTARASTRNSGRDGRMEDIDYLRRAPGGESDIQLPFDDGWDLPDEDVVPREAKRLRMFPGVGSEPPGFDTRYEPHQLGGSNGSNHSGSGGPAGYGNTRLLPTGDYSHGLGPRPRGGTARTEGVHPPLDNLRVSMGHGSGPSPGLAVPQYGKQNGYGGESGAAGAAAGAAVAAEGWQWHGTIAKGGTPVCRARCLPVGKGIDVTVPDVVNCTARTDLDMLAKHVFQAGDFGVVFFVPEGDPDVPPYQDFMHYLGEKHRAGVAKLADGTSLFLVPPSEFSERVLKVPGQNCLFGVVLKFMQQAPGPNFTPPPHQQQAPSLPQHPSAFPQQQQLLSQHAPSQQSPFLQQVSAPMMNAPPTQGPSGFQGSMQVSPLQGQPLNVANASPAQLTPSQLASIATMPGGLTPELIASLTALLPQNSTDGNTPLLPVSGGQSTYSGNGGMSLGSIPTVRASTPMITPALQTDVRPAPSGLRPPSSPLPLPPPGWAPAQHTPQDQPQQQSGAGNFHSQSPNHGSYFMIPPPQQQQQLQPHLSQQQYQQPSHPLVLGGSASGTGSLLGQSPAMSGSQMQQGYGYVGQQFIPPPQIPRPPQQPVGPAPQQPVGSAPQQPVGAAPQQPVGAAPQLPSDQLAQLTALLTRRQQQPAQQQAAAQLLQQHYQQQPTSHSPTSSLPPQHHPLQPQQALTPQLQPLMQSLPQQQQSQSELPHYGQMFQPQWGPSSSSQLQPSSLSHPQPHQLPQPPQPQPQAQPQQQQIPQSVTQVQHQQVLPRSQGTSWENGATHGTIAADLQGASQNQGVGEPDAQQKRFQATLQLAAALLQQMQQQQGKPQAE